MFLFYPKIEIKNHPQKTHIINDRYFGWLDLQKMDALHIVAHIQAGHERLSGFLWC